MTVIELIYALCSYPPDDEVKIAFGDTTIPVDAVYHNSVYDQHYVILD